MSTAIEEVQGAKGAEEGLLARPGFQRKHSEGGKPELRRQNEWQLATRRGRGEECSVVRYILSPESKFIGKIGLQNENEPVRVETKGLDNEGSCKPY